MSADRQPPHSVAAEKAILASLLLRPALIQRIGLELQVDEFFRPEHREIYESFLTLDQKHKPIDVVTIADDLRSRGVLAKIEGGETYLMALDTPSTENVDHHIEVVQEKYRLRELIKACAAATSSAYGDAESTDVMDGLSATTLKIQTRKKGDLRHVKDELSPLMDEFEARHKRRDSGDENAGVTGVRTGITKLDRLTTGYQPGDLIVVAGGTSSGKTAHTNQTAINLCLAGGTALLFQLEMSRRQLVERAFAHISETNSALLREGRINAEDFARLQEAGRRLYGTSMFIHDDCFTPRDILATARRWRTRNPTAQGLICVDFVQLVRCNTGSRNESRAREIGVFTQGLKELAKELGVPVVLVSQLNRAGMKSETRPTKYDLKESGDIENAADVILLIHNPDETGDGIVNGYVDKNRNGECKRVLMHWRGRYYQFRDPGQDDVREEEPYAA